MGPIVARRPGGLGHGRSRLCALAVGLVLGLGAAGPSAGAPPDEPTAAEPAEAAEHAGQEDALEACRRRADEAAVVDRQAAMCFYERVAIGQGRWAEARRELEARVAVPGSSPMLRLALACLLANSGDAERAVTLLREVLGELPAGASVGDRATVLANLATYLRALGRYDEAEVMFVELEALGRERGVLEIELAGRIELGMSHMRRGGDLSEIRDGYDRIVARAIAEGSYSVGNKALLARGQLAIQQRRWPQAREDLELVAARARARGDRYDEAYALVERLKMELLALGDAGELDMPPSLRERLEQARRAVQASEHPHVTAYLLEVEADIAASEGRPHEAAETYGRCAEGFEAMGVKRQALSARASQAMFLALAGDHARARALAQASDREARALGLRDVVSWSGCVRTLVAIEEGDLDHALELAAVHFDDIEANREVQGDELDRSRRISDFSDSYYLVSGALLRASDPARSDRLDRLDRAFRIIERLRARNLLDGLRHAEALRPDPNDPDEQRWQETVTEIAAVQRTLRLPSLADAARAEALERLERLEAQERRLRGVLAEGDGELGTLLRPRFPHLSEVQAALGPEQALLSYQLADEVGRFGAPEGGAWLWVITRDAVNVHALPERRALEPRLAFVTGLLGRRDGREERALAALHRDLLAPALAELPPEVSHLVIVPDGELWSLPFEALRPEPGAAPLVTRHALSLVPSVTSWMRWGEAPPAAIEPGLLALAQPGLGPEGLGPARREGTLATGLRLEALPRAGEEVEAITRIWGGRLSRAEVGEQASERFLKASDLSRFGLVHFATHAVTDPRHPERSAVVLAAGGEDEDGLLQAREIVRLPLRDKVVVLSACSGAAGAFVRGEGVMSLARAFLQGGARAVVASRWPLADADAVALFERLYLHLDDGLPLSEALARAQRELHEAGVPAAAWAGVVVLGRGDVVLVPRPAWWPWRRVLLGVGAMLAAALGAWLGLRVRGQQRRGPAARGRSATSIAPGRSPRA